MKTARQNAFSGLLHGKLLGCANSIRAQWARPEGTTTRHFVVDDLLPAGICREIHAAFPRNGAGFFNRDSFREQKKISANLDVYDPILTDLTCTLVRLPHPADR